MEPEERDCSHCSLDTVELRDVIMCAWRSAQGVCRDLMNGHRDISYVFLRNDRIVYIVAVVVMVVALRSFLLCRENDEYIIL